MEHNKMMIDERIEQLDLSLFSHIASETTEEDKRTLLALQAAFRKRFPGYVYLEIGSFRGGSIQQHVVNPKCGGIISIDPRPGSAPCPGGTFKYPDASASSMLAGLQQIPGADASKIKTFETTAARLTGEKIGARPQLCSIDGEHTDEAVVGDTRFCLSVLAENGAILFHDANLVFTGLQAFLNELSAGGRAFHPHILPGSVFLIEVGAMRYCETEPLRGQVEENCKAYLAGMADNNWYRRACHLPVYRALRKVRRLFPRRS